MPTAGLDQLGPGEERGPGVYLADIYAYMSVEILICVPTVFGNVLILVSIAMFPRLRIRKNVLIANLAVSDLLVGTVLIPVDLVGIVWVDLADAKYFCLVELTLYVCLLGTSVMNIFIISLERFIFIVYPMWHRKHFRTHFLYVIIAAVWILMFAMAALPLFGLNTFTRDVPCTSDYVLPFVYKVVLSCIVFIPCCVSFAMYAVVLRIAIGQYKKTIAHCRKGRKVARRTLIMMFIFGIFVICWSPFAVLQVVSPFLRHTTCIFRLRNWFALLGLLNSGLNWMVYGLMNRQFRRAFRNVIHCRFKAGFYRVSYVGAPLELFRRASNCTNKSCDNVEAEVGPDTQSDTNETFMNETNDGL